MALDKRLLAVGRGGGQLLRAAGALHEAECGGSERSRGSADRLEERDWLLGSGTSRHRAGLGAQS